MVADEASWVPPGIDTTKASIARVYDWWLGGEHNFLVDQDAARAMIAVEPKTRAIARAYRAFLIRAVRFLAGEAGIRQFLDIGSGIPTAQNVHQVAQETAPGSRVVYVDNDDIAVAHSRLLLEGNPDTAVILADLRDPRAILDHPETRRLIDFSQPVGLLLAAVLHFIPDSDGPEEILATLTSPLVPGSYLAISHACRDADPDVAAAYETAYSSRVTASSAFRTRGQIARLFDGFTLVDPGLVWIPEWRPDFPGDVPEDPAELWAMAGVGKRGELTPYRYRFCHRHKTAATGAPSRVFSSEFGQDGRCGTRRVRSGCGRRLDVHRPRGPLGRLWPAQRPTGNLIMVAWQRG